MTQMNSHRPKGREWVAAVQRPARSQQDGHRGEQLTEVLDNRREHTDAETLILATVGPQSPAYLPRN